MNQYDLKRKVMQTAHSSHWFSRENMKFSGDTLANFYVKAKPVEIEDTSGNKRMCWELQRVRANKRGAYASSYFDCETFEHVSKR